MRRAIAFAAIPILASALFAYEPEIKPASDEALRVMAKFRVPPGLKVELWAAEPMLANPVALAFDEHGRCYVAETFRHSQGVPDIRGYMSWLDDDLASRTVADRLAMYKKHLGDKLDSYTVHHERVRQIVDSKGTGKADKATVFADGFNTHVSGIGAGVLARQGKVWYTCIPDLWQLQDTKGTGVADVRKSLSTGYGVHVGFIGHDLHGLRMGPDGKLYFSIGDRALNVTGIDGRTVSNPDSGAVLRCNPDGTELELFATGLRNPQELAFNEYGDLFTCDNNSDGGDKARWVHVVEGGDSGWRIGYQFLDRPVPRGVWNSEKLWHPAPENTGTYLVPPLFNIADGPSGLTYHPGTGLPDAYRGHFFLCDFRGGTSGRSGIRAVKLKQKGASYELEETKEFFWSILATDCDFAPDGNLYVSDWTEGWDLPKKGRIYRVVDPSFQGSAVQKEVMTLLAEGMDKRPIAELTKLLGHADQRVREEAQFALAAKGKDAIGPLAAIATGGSNRLARIHAIWGLGQIGSKLVPPGQLGSMSDDSKGHVASLFKDADDEVRAQAARVTGWNHWIFISQLTELMQDPAPRVRFHAGIAFSQMQWRSLSAGSQYLSRPNTVRRILVENEGDAYLRHAAVRALGRLRPGAVQQLASDEMPSVRLGALLLWRRARSEEVARFLDDKDPQLVLEAARAIQDVPVPDAEPKLAAMINRPNLSEGVARRALVANFRQGAPANAAAVAKFAAQPDAPESQCVEGLELLGTWAKPSGRDRITGLWRPLPERPVAIAADAVKSVLPELLRGREAVRVQAVMLCGTLGLSDSAALLTGIFGDAQQAPLVRAEALKSLAALRAAGWESSVERAVADAAPPVRLAALEQASRLSPTVAMKVLGTAAERGSARERQVAITALGNIRDTAAEAIFAKLLDQLLAGRLPAEVHLDLLTAAAKHPTVAIRDKLAKFDASRPKTDHLAEWRESLAGGDADRGKNVFWDKQEVACLRCHKVGEEGGEVGPNLSDIGKRQNREYILESIVLPNKQIAQGFETVVVTMTNGKIYAGVLRHEDTNALTVVTAEGSTLHLPKNQIDTRDRGDSAMPADVMKYLSKSELRDLVEYLVGQKADVK
jgi:quinoprotein glucose dehydrogenase